MKVETPQLRWHQIVNPTCQKDAGANGPILSCSLLTIDSTTGVLATAGNTEVNLWRIQFTSDNVRSTTRGILVQPLTKNNAASFSSHPTTTMDGHNSNGSNMTMNEHTGIEHIVTLSRGTNERTINAVKFSPSGRYLVAAGDSGTVVSYALPPSSSSISNPMNNLSYWTSIEKETDLNMKMLFNHSDDVMDISWSTDSKRFVVCSLDHTLTVWENHTTQTTGSTSGSNGGGSNSTTGGGSGGSNSSDDGNNWRSVHRSNKDHTHYIQGVTFDPKGVYLASMGSDRMVKVYTRKEISERTLTAELAKYEIEENTVVGPKAMEEESGVYSEERHGCSSNDKAGIIRESKVLPGLLTNSTFALQNKIKTIKFLTTSNGNSTGGKDHRANVDSSSGTAMVVDEKDKGDLLKCTSITNASAAAATTKRHHMFADELTLGSFFRRLSFTTDGAFLVVPAALWHGIKSTIEEKDSGAGGGVGHPRSPTSVSSMSESSFCTYLFARHHFDQPYKVLTGLEKPSVVIRPNPVLFQLPPSATSSLSSYGALPYRSIFAVLTTDTVVIYDTHHNRPIAMARGLHYAGLTDAAWSADGRTLFVTSSDGYISILSFGLGELGNVYVVPVANIVERKKVMPDVVSDETNVVENISEIASVVEASKHQANLESTETVMEERVISEIVTTTSAKKKVRFDDPLDDRSNQPDHLDSLSAINTLVPKKKKKKIAPTLLIGDTTAQQIDTSSNVEQKKRPANEEPPSGESEVTTPVNFLLAKKKTKITTTPSSVV